MRPIYVIHKGVERPVVFKGLIGQYIWWIGMAFCGLLLLFAVMYMIQVPLIICLAVVAFFGTSALVFSVRLSKQYGEHGWMKKSAERYIPKHVKGCVIE